MKSYAAIGLAMILAATLAASARAKDYPLQIKVLSAEEHQTLGPSERAMEGCNWRDIDAYCYASAPVQYTVNTMTVEENGGQPFRITCTAYRWSHCTDLPVDMTFSAREQKGRLVTLYTDKNGKRREERYEIAGSAAQSRE